MSRENYGYTVLLSGISARLPDFDCRHLARFIDKMFGKAAIGAFILREVRDKVALDFTTSEDAMLGQNMIDGVTYTMDNGTSHYVNARVTHDEKFLRTEPLPVKCRSPRENLDEAIAKHIKQKAKSELLAIKRRIADTEVSPNPDVLEGIAPALPEEKILSPNKSKKKRHRSPSDSSSDEASSRKSTKISPSLDLRLKLKRSYKEKSELRSESRDRSYFQAEGDKFARFRDRGDPRDYLRSEKDKFRERSDPREYPRAEKDKFHERSDPREYPRAEKDKFHERSEYREHPRDEGDKFRERGDPREYHRAEKDKFRERSEYREHPRAEGEKYRERGDPKEYHRFEKDKFRERDEHREYSRDGRYNGERERGHRGYSRDPREHRPWDEPGPSHRGRDRDHGPGSLRDHDWHGDRHYKHRDRSRSPHYGPDPRYGRNSQAKSERFHKPASYRPNISERFNPRTPFRDENSRDFHKYNIKKEFGVAVKEEPDMENKERRAIKLVLMELKEVMNQFKEENNIDDKESKLVLQSMYQTVTERMEGLSLSQDMGVDEIFIKYRCSYSKVEDAELLKSMLRSRIDARAPGARRPETSRSMNEWSLNTLDMILQEFDNDISELCNESNVVNTKKECDSEMNEAENQNNTLNIVVKIERDMNQKEDEQGENEADKGEKNEADKEQTNNEENNNNDKTNKTNKNKKKKDVLPPSQVYSMTDGEFQVQITVNNKRQKRFYRPVLRLIRQLKPEMKKHKAHIQLELFEYIVKLVLEKRFAKLLEGTYERLKTTALIDLYRDEYPIEDDDQFIIETLCAIWRGEYNDSVYEDVIPEKFKSKIKAKELETQKETINNGVDGMDIIIKTEPAELINNQESDVTAARDNEQNTRDATMGDDITVKQEKTDTIVPVTVENETESNIKIKTEPVLQNNSHQEMNIKVTIKQEPNLTEQIEGEQSCSTPSLRADITVKKENTETIVPVTVETKTESNVKIKPEPVTQNNNNNQEINTQGHIEQEPNLTEPNEGERSCSAPSLQANITVKKEITETVVPVTVENKNESNVKIKPEPVTQNNNNNQEINTQGHIEQEPNLTEPNEGERSCSAPLLQANITVKKEITETVVPVTVEKKTESNVKIKIKTFTQNNKEKTTQGHIEQEPNVTEPNNEESCLKPSLPDVIVESEPIETVVISDDEEEIFEDDDCKFVIEYSVNDLPISENNDTTIPDTKKMSGSAVMSAIANKSTVNLSDIVNVSAVSKESSNLIRNDSNLNKNTDMIHSAAANESSNLKKNVNVSAVTNDSAVVHESPAAKASNVVSESLNSDGSLRVNVSAVVNESSISNVNANLNTGTNKCHYSDVAALLEDLGDETLEQISEFITNH